MSLKSTLLQISLSMFAASCSARESTPSTPSSVFRIGNLVLFETNSRNELLPTAPRYEKTPAEVLPRLSYSINNKVAATLTAADKRTIPSAQAEPWNLESHCKLDNTIKASTEILAKLAKQKNPYTLIDTSLAKLSDCETKKVLDCFLNELNATSWSDFTEANERGLSLKSIVSKLGQCTGSEELWTTKNHFEVIKGDILFFPDVVKAIYIYEGELNGYEYANDNFDSVAKLVNPRCEDNCFVSPQSISALTACSSCKPLVSGKLYTAFLQTRRSARDQDFVRILFRSP
jgi:hypothetical protein